MGQAPITVIEVQVRPSDYDPLNHVNNSRYLEFLEMGRTAWYEDAGLGAAEKARLGIDTVQVNININFRKEIGPTRAVKVVTRPLRRGRTSFTVYQEIRSIDDEVVHADAEVTSVTFDLKNRTKYPLPPDFASRFPE